VYVIYLALFSEKRHLSPAAQKQTLSAGDYRLRLKKKPSLLLIIACGSKNPSVLSFIACGSK
jgi:hypothetical protein